MFFNNIGCIVFSNFSFVFLNCLENWLLLGFDILEVKGFVGVNVVVSIIGIVGNFLVCFVVKKFCFLGRLKVELFIVSLVVVDLLVCVFV